MVSATRDQSRPEPTQPQLGVRAARAEHSMEHEIRQIQTASTQAPDDPFSRLVDRARKLGGVDLELPPPDRGAGVDLSDESFG